MDMSLSKLPDIVKDREARHVQRVTELDTTEWLNNIKESYCFYDLENTNIYSVKLLFRFFYFKWNNTECLIFRAS